MTKPVFPWLFWAFVFHVFVLALIDTRFTWSRCLEHERSLLLQLKETLDLNIPESTGFATWNETLDCCQWRGVQCNDSTGHVIGLDLSSESINGGIDNSGSLLNLQFLKSLNLANNSFNNVRIPSAFGKLTGLTYLNLSNAGFSGQVPIEISQLINLETLDLSSGNNYLLGLSPLKLENPSLGTLIGNFRNIRELHLDGVIISANGSEFWKELSSSVPNLEVLSMSSCNLSGEIDSSLEKLSSLSEIILSQNNFATEMPEFLANFRNLTVLKMSNCELKGTVPQRILQVATLKILDLSYNSLLQGSLPEFPVKGSLQTLILSFTSFSGELPNSIGNLTQLSRIELQQCNFSGMIPSSMASLKQLVYLDFSVNQFSGPIPSFSAAKRLTHVDLSMNSLTGSIPMSLFWSPSLRKLQLYQNEFSGKLAEFSFRPSLILDTLDLSNNTLQGPIPKSLFGLKGLEVLKLSFNNFSGYLNLSMIHDLQNLTTLELSQNYLSVYANDSSEKISSFPQLTTLKLGSCKLNVLPNFLRNQSRLCSLDLSDNQIRGKIPRWIWTVGSGTLSYLNLSCNNFVNLELPLPNTPALNFLDIHSNKLHGEIPTLSSPLTYLDYSDNRFTSIQPGIGTSLLYTVFLSISKNKLSGVIPDELCNATILLVLDLSRNNLSGTLPDCVIKMTRTLMVLNLRGNKLHGVIPNAFPIDCISATIDISDNSLQGELPRSLAKCKKLVVLDLGINKLHGIFPAWLMSLPNLRVLVLRGNKFHGSMSCPFSNASSSMLQIIDLAANELNGELKPQCIQKLTALKGPANYSQVKLTGIQYPVLRLQNIYYQDTVVVSYKGEDIELQKTLTLFGSIDFSKNKFDGNIPEVIGDLSRLIALNLSQNAFSGPIPTSIGNLSELESLDLSQNKLQGKIPPQLASLHFLEVLNLSCNILAGTIPTGSQLQSFDKSSYAGNVGLCGAPLPPCPASYSWAISPTPLAKKREVSFTKRIDWETILLGSGFGTGGGLVIAPFLFWKKFRRWYDKQLDKLAWAILSLFGISISDFDEGSIGSEEAIGHQLFEINPYNYDDDDDDDDDGGTEVEEDYVRFCIFCSKLDIGRKRVIHNPRCTCHGSPTITPSSLSSSST